MEKEKNSLFSVADIVKRAKRVLNFKTDADLAAYLGVSRSHLVTGLRVTVLTFRCC